MGSDPLRGTVHAVLAAVCYSGFLYLLRRGGRTGQVRQVYTAVVASAAVVSLAAGLLWYGFDPAPGWRVLGWLLAVAACSQVVGWLLVATASPRLAGHVGAVLLLLTPVGAVALGAVVRGERPTPLQLAGCGLILASAYAMGRGDASGDARAGVDGGGEVMCRSSPFGRAPNMAEFRPRHFTAGYSAVAAHVPGTRLPRRHRPPDTRTARVLRASRRNVLREAKVAVRARMETVPRRNTGNRGQEPDRHRARTFLPPLGPPGSRSGAGVDAFHAQHTRAVNSPSMLCRWATSRRSRLLWQPGAGARAPREMGLLAVAPAGACRAEVGALNRRMCGRVGR